MQTGTQQVSGSGVLGHLEMMGVSRPLPQTLKGFTAAQDGAGLRKVEQFVCLGHSTQEPLGLRRP